LIGQGSIVTGSSARFRSFDSSGALIGQGSVIDGSAIRIPPGGITHDTSGAMVGQGSVISGLALISSIVVSGGAGNAFNLPSRKYYAPKDIKDSIERQKDAATKRPTLKLKQPVERKEKPKEYLKAIIKQRARNDIIAQENNAIIDSYNDGLMAYLTALEGQLEEENQVIATIIAELL